MADVGEAGLEQTLELSSAAETFALGERLGRLLEPGDFVGLIGELGAGKTLFVRGVARGAGVPEGQVSSPSFAIVYPYQGRLTVFHADLYRLTDYDELYATGFFDLVGKDGAMLVEWLDKIPQAAPPESLTLRFEVTGDDTRRVRVTAVGGRHRQLAEAWLSAPGVG
ncbi:MAG: tRNA (adenosine(37)-N6)-threonylcarbamoyltransferase complex ATPase subunit type 1 TsaE [Myxococcaceae bacterium]